MSRCSLSPLASRLLPLASCLSPLAPTRTLLRRAAPGLLIAALALTAAACGGGAKKSDAPAATFDTAAATATATADATTEATAVATPQFPEPAQDAKLVRLLIPAAKVNAPLQVKGVNARNEMENPDGKDNVAWYDFSGFPGFGSNAVFSGHVDWFTGEAGVFWYLKDVKQGDEITVKTSDGMELKYRITQVDVYPAADAPVAEIVGPTSTDSVTLITCEGTFNKSAQDYDKRRVVRAQRVA